MDISTRPDLFAPLGFLGIGRWKKVQHNRRLVFGMSSDLLQLVLLPTYEKDGNLYWQYGTRAWCDRSTGTRVSVIWCSAPVKECWLEEDGHTGTVPVPYRTHTRSAQYAGLPKWASPPTKSFFLHGTPGVNLTEKWRLLPLSVFTDAKTKTKCVESLCV